GRREAPEVGGLPLLPQARRLLRVPPRARRERQRARAVRALRGRDHAAARQGGLVPRLAGIEERYEADFSGRVRNAVVEWDGHAIRIDRYTTWTVDDGQVHQLIATPRRFVPRPADALGR